MPQTIPDSPPGLDPSLTATDVARDLHTALSCLARAFTILRVEPLGEGRYEAQMQIYLARETIAGVLAWTHEKESAR